MCVDDENLPYAFVLIDGIAAVETEPEDQLYWTTRIAGHYMGSEMAEVYGKRNGVPGE